MDTQNFDEFMESLQFLKEKDATSVTTTEIVVKPAKVRKKRPYKHASYVCDTCRKSHRKCIHPKPEEAVTESGEVRLAKIAERSSLVLYEQIRTVPGAQDGTVSIPVDLASSSVPSAPIRFYIENLGRFFVVPNASSQQAAFWTGIVPQLAHSSPLLGRSMLGLCYLFERCPRPSQLTPEVVLQHIESTFRGLQVLLAQFDHLGPLDKVISIVVTTFLAIGTFHGIGSTEALQAHIHGMHALLQKAWSDLVDASSPARKFFLAAPKALVKADQLPIRVQDLNLLEPLIKCIPDEELDRPKIRYGSLVHLLILTNKAIYARGSSDANRIIADERYEDEDGELESQSASTFRDFCEYRANLPHDEALRWVCNARVPFKLATAICKVFEQATFMQLKKQSSVQEHNFASNIRYDIITLQGLIASLKKLDPNIQVYWAEQVLQDVGAYDVPIVSSTVETRPSGKALTRHGRSASLTHKLQPWSRLDEILSAPDRPDSAGSSSSGSGGGAHLSTSIVLQ